MVVAGTWSVFLLRQHFSVGLQLTSHLLFLSSTLMRTLLIGFRSHPSDTGWLHLKIYKLIASPQTPFPSEVIATIPGRQMYEVFWRCSIVELIRCSRCSPRKGDYHFHIPLPGKNSKSYFLGIDLIVAPYWLLETMSLQSLVKAYQAYQL